MRTTKLPALAYCSRHQGTPRSVGLHREEGAALPGRSREPQTHTSPSLCRAFPQEGRSGSLQCSTERDKRVDPSFCLRTALVGLQTCGVKVRLPHVSSSPKTCPPGYPAWAEPCCKGLMCHRPSELGGCAGHFPQLLLGAFFSGTALCSPESQPRPRP